MNADIAYKARRSALKRWVLLQRRKKMANCKSTTPSPEESPPQKPKRPKRKDKPQEQSTAIAKLRILQRQFENANENFPELGHVAIQRGKNGMYPAIHIGLETTSSKFRPLYWVRDEKMPRESDEVGYPTKHWLHFFDTGKYNVDTIMRIVHKFSDLAWKAGEIAAKMNGKFLPVSKAKLWVTSWEEYWILLLHYFNQPTRWTIPYSERKITILGDKPEQREAEEGEPYFCWVENVFFESAVLCETLLANHASTKQKNIGSKKRRKYTVDFLKRVQTTFDQRRDGGMDVKGAWNEAADAFGIKSGKAAEMACRRYIKKQNK